jgi:hypothetical protein
MQISGFGQVFLAGAFGGLLIEILRWWKLRDAAELPAYRTSLFYWSITIAMICVGGILATLYGIDNRSALMVVNLGASAPALIGALSSPGATKESEARRVTRSAKASVPSEQQRAYQFQKFLSFGNASQDK